MKDCSIRNQPVRHGTSFGRVGDFTVLHAQMLSLVRNMFVTLPIPLFRVVLSCVVV